MAPCREAMGNRGVKACVVFSRPLEDVSRLASSIRLTKGNHRGVDRMRVTNRILSDACTHAWNPTNDGMAPEFGQNESKFRKSRNYFTKFNPFPAIIALPKTPPRY